MSQKESLSLPALIRSLFGTGVSITKRNSVSGGDINEAFLLELSDGNRIFMKTNRGKGPSFYEAEAEGLLAIAKTGTIGTPKVLGIGVENAAAFLLLEYVNSSKRIPDFWETFGSALADMHTADAASFVPDGRFGFHMDNIIGATKQINTPKNTWIDFYRACRLAPQFEMASSYFDHTEKSRALHLLDHLDDLLTEPETPSLLHGDLWGGNFMTGENGHAILIDPAVYVGHPEADLAMTELFGGFARDFYEAYFTKKPLQPGYEDRRDLYHLYQLLNHLNLFGGSYYSSVMRILRHYT